MTMLEKTQQKIDKHIRAAVQAMENGFDCKAAQDRAIEQLRYAADGIKDIYQETYLQARRDNCSTEAQQEIYYGFPELHLWGKVLKDGTNSTTKYQELLDTNFPQLTGFSVLFSELSEMRAAIKSTVITKKPSKSQIKQEFLEGRKENVEILSRLLDQIKQDAIKGYKESAVEAIKRTCELMDRHNNNLLASLRQLSDQQRQHVSMIMDIDSWGKTSRSAEKENAFIKMYEDHAITSFNEFVHKITLRLGDATVVDARHTGHIWSNSLIDLTLEDGTTKAYRTTCILNTSKFGKLFNQWPTREC